MNKAPKITAAVGIALGAAALLALLATLVAIVLPLD